MTASFCHFSHDGHSFDFHLIYLLSFETLWIPLVFKKVLSFYRGRRLVGSSP